MDSAQSSSVEFADGRYASWKRILTRKLTIYTSHPICRHENPFFRQIAPLFSFFSSLSTVLRSNLFSRPVIDFAAPTFINHINVPDMPSTNVTIFYKFPVISAPNNACVLVYLKNKDNVSLIILFYEVIEWKRETLCKKFRNSNIMRKNW